MPFFSQVQHQEDLYDQVVACGAGAGRETLQLAFMNFLCTVQKLQRNAEIHIYFSVDLF